MLMPTDIKYYQEFGGEKVVFEKEEIAEMKKFADPGVRTARGERAGGSTTVRGNPQDWNLGVQKGCNFTFHFQYFSTTELLYLLLSQG